MRGELEDLLDVGAHLDVVENLFFCVWGVNKREREKGRKGDNDVRVIQLSLSHLSLSIFSPYLSHLVALVDHKVAQRPELEVALLGQLLDAARRADDDVRRRRAAEDVLVLLDGQAAEEVGDADACCFFGGKKRRGKEDGK